MDERPHYNRPPLSATLGPADTFPVPIVRQMQYVYIALPPLLSSHLSNSVRLYCQGFLCTRLASRQ